MTEMRRTVGQPTVMPVLVGAVPYVKSHRWFYAARLFYSGETSDDQYQAIVQTSDGQYIDQGGAQLSPPEFFTPTEYKVRTTGGGLGVGYDRGPALKAAVTLDHLQNDIAGTNDGARYASQTDEKRPYINEQLALVGRLGRNLEWGVDGRNWTSASEEHWFFSLSAGVGADPLTGRGKLLERDESGRSLRWRVRWTRGPLEMGGGVSTLYRKITITPPAANDLTSLNHFLDVVTYRQNADSLALPDSVSRWGSEQRSWESGGGLALKLPGGRGTWGAECHVVRSLTEQTTSGAGPLRRAWDIRTGIEYPCTPVMAGRVGYMYRWEDENTYVAQNEFVGQTVTLGIGIRPAGTAWTLDAGYAVDWLNADYGAPLASHGCRQQLASRIRWAF
jgi:hypothetical protein